MTTSPLPVHSAVVDNFSLVRGGYLYGVEQKLRMAPEDRNGVWRRILLTVAITWVPLFCLSLVEGTFLSHTVTMPFAGDFATNVRFLITLPLLIFAQTTVDRRTNEAVRHFTQSGLVTSEVLPAFERVLAKTVRLRDTPIFTVVLFLLAFAPSVLLPNAEMISHGTSTWQAQAGAHGNLGHSMAGFYNLIVSFPIYRLVFYRWLWLVFVWTTFLWRSSRLPLQLTPAHPDGAGGLGFLGHAQLFFAPVVLAASAVVAAGLGNIVAYEGQTVDSLKFQMIAFAVAGIVIFAAPLLVVTPTLFELKEKGLLDYHTLGVEYTQAFDRKWIRDKAGVETEPGHDALLGTSDIQSMADLNSTVSIVQDMSLVLIDREVLVGLAVPVAAPMLVLVATAMPLDKLLEAVSHLLF